MTIYDNFTQKIYSGNTDQIVQTTQNCLQTFTIVETSNGEAIVFSLENLKTCGLLFITLTKLLKLKNILVNGVTSFFNVFPIRMTLFGGQIQLLNHKISLRFH